MTILLRTDQAFPSVIDGRSISTPLACILKVDLGPAIGMKEQPFIDFLHSVVGPEVERSQPKAIRRGQTEAEVIDILGPPANVVDLDDKKMLVYPNLKITLERGRVVQVE